jgi:hypothetical protein
MLSENAISNCLLPHVSQMLSVEQDQRNRVVKGNQLALEVWAVKEFDFDDFAKGSACVSHV